MARLPQLCPTRPVLCLGRTSSCSPGVLSVRLEAAAGLCSPSLPSGGLLQVLSDSLLHGGSAPLQSDRIPFLGCLLEERAGEVTGSEGRAEGCWTEDLLGMSQA